MVWLQMFLVVIEVDGYSSVSSHCDDQSNNILSDFVAMSKVSFIFFNFFTFLIGFALLIWKTKVFRS